MHSLQESNEKLVSFVHFFGFNARITLTSNPFDTDSVAELKLGRSVLGQGDDDTSAFVPRDARAVGLEWPVILNHMQIGL